MSTPLLSLSRVSRRYLRAEGGDDFLAVLSEVSMNLQAGESVALTGPSGSGKSTLIHLCAGLDRPDEGSICWRGAPLEQLDDEQLAGWRRQKVGFVFQDFRLLGHLSALENVCLPLELLGASFSEASAQGKHLLNTLGLGDRLHHRPRQLSGGEQQRVAIGRAFVHQPALILADEPTGNLDPVTSKTVIDALLQLQQAHKSALLVVTHDLVLANRLNRKLALVEGQLIREEFRDTQEPHDD